MYYSVKGTIRGNTVVLDEDIEKLEGDTVIVTFIGRDSKKKPKENIDDLVSGLTGIIPDPGMSLQDYRDERLGLS